MNRVILVGRTTMQPELRVTPGGTQISTFALAVDRPPRDGKGKETDFLDIVVFGKLAEIVAKYVYKGQQVAVDGKLQTRTFETKDGQKRKVWEIIAENVQFLGGKKRDDYGDDEGNFDE